MLSFHETRFVFTSLRNIGGLINARHYSSRNFFGHNSPAAVARELFKPSTNPARLLVLINSFFYLGGGFLLATSQRRDVFEFLTNFTWSWTPIQ